jgi:hypothetical protein
MQAYYLHWLIAPKDVHCDFYQQPGGLLVLVAHK